MKIKAGPDPDFPYLDERRRFSFPPPEESIDESVVIWGGNLSPGMLLSAYEQGIFPWYSEDEPVIWHSPDPRFVIFSGDLHVSKSMKKILSRGDFTVTLDKDFEGVIRSCSEIERPEQGGTWISEDIIKAYTELHRLGWAHSAEAWADGSLAGGCYGIRIGPAFFGESMFTKKTNASKAAFLTLAELLFSDDVRFIDCQMHTAHLESLGGKELGRKSFICLLRETLRERKPRTPEADALDRRGNWGERYFGG